MNEQVGIDLTIGDRKLKAYEVSKFATSFYLRFMHDVRICQQLPDGTHSIDTDIECEWLEKNRLFIGSDAGDGFMEIDNKKYILLEIMPKKIIT
jgi:hypothetical protein